MKTINDVRKWRDQIAIKDAQFDTLRASAVKSAIDILFEHFDAQPKRAVRKLAKTVPLRVTLEQFRTISDSRITCTLLVADKDAKYHTGMLAIVMEFDQERARFTQRQTLRIISHVWHAVPGYDADTVILALQPVEDAR